MEREKTLESTSDALINIRESTSKINLKMHGQYVDEDLAEVEKQIEIYISNASTIWEKYSLTASPDKAEHPNKIKYRGIDECYKSINDLFSKKDIDSDEEESRLVNIENEYRKLLDLYNDLIYNFQTANMELDMVNNAEEVRDIGIILLSKNVRIMEDLVNRICGNNIDKSIITGDKHIDSVKYGFKWLFCHNSTNKSESDKRIDIRDRNRYLDYIKYQIMVASKYVSNSPKTSVGIDQCFEKVSEAFKKEEFEFQAGTIRDFKENAKKLIDEFFLVYKLLVSYRDALFREEEIKKSLSESGAEKKLTSIREADIKMINISSIAVRVLLDRFVSFVKISDLNFGNSTFDRSWFNFSELSRSNYAGSSFKRARIENAKMKECDISTCNLSLADCSSTDFSHSIFNYTNLTGINLMNATVNNCDFENAIFRDSGIDSYKNAIQESWNDRIREKDRIIKLLRLWDYTFNDEQCKRNLLQAFQKIECIDIDLSEKAMPVKILGFNFENERIISQAFWKLLRLNFKEHISEELFQFVKQRLETGKESAIVKKKRIKKYGKVRSETAELEGISAKNARMAGCDLSHIHMQNASFENTDLNGSTMYYSNAERSSFIASNLNQAACFESNFDSANFSNSVINNAVFLNCNMNHTNWNRAILIGCEFIDLSEYVECAIMEETQAEKIHLFLYDYIDFKDGYNAADPICDFHKTFHISDPKESCFWQKNCGINDSSLNSILADKAVFVNISAERSSFCDASLKNSMLSNCKMYLSDFIRADFRYANILLCYMGQSNFSNANLTDTNIKYADFYNSNMENMLLNLSKINHVLFVDANLSGVNLSGAEVRNSAFVSSRMQQINLVETKFVNCIFSDIKFTDLIGVHSAVFKNCYVYNCTYNSFLRRDGMLNQDTFFSQEWIED